MPVNVSFVYKFVFKIFIILYTIIITINKKYCTESK